MSIIQGGSGFPFLAPPVYDYLVTGKCTGITVDNRDVPDHLLQFVLQKVSLCNGGGGGDGSEIFQDCHSK